MYVWDGERALHNDVIELLPENGMVDGVVRAAVADLHLAIEIPDARFEPFDTIGPAQIAADGDSISDEETRNLALMMMGGGAISARAVPHGGIGMPWATSGRVPRELAKTADEVVEFFYNPTPKELARQLS